jgi:hypothetical protein
MIKNMTPHDVNIVGLDGAVKKTYPSDGLIRLSTKTVEVGEDDGVLLTRTEFGEPEGLPELVPGTYLIVSQLVKSALPERTDLVVPAEMVRDENGRIVGCRSLGI